LILRVTPVTRGENGAGRAAAGPFARGATS